MEKTKDLKTRADKNVYPTVLKWMAWGELCPQFLASTMTCRFMPDPSGRYRVLQDDDLGQIEQS
jgi:hypothetical protein